ncbi:hypothetical protein TcWFU_006099 [Taenia crassiceps]|uniref:PEST proteolytic signal-containing nuclear protein n=1 Tax=Taenia crassiceps TaxID=6207 RepID=A0ABR4Q9J6_9CEST
MPLFITSGQDFDRKASVDALSSRGAKGAPSSRESAAVAKQLQNADPATQKPKNAEEPPRSVKKKGAKLVDAPEKPLVPIKMESKHGDGDTAKELRKDFV